MKYVSFQDIIIYYKFEMAWIFINPESVVNSLWPSEAIHDVDLGQHWLR